MKKTFFVLLCIGICICASAQVKVYSDRVSIGGEAITLKPSNPGPEIGAWNGSRWSTIKFKHNSAGWNKLQAKSFNTVSDSCFKTDVEPIEEASLLLRQVKTYSYRFKENEEEDVKRSYGVIAQELAAIIPDMVDTVDGFLCVDYDEFVPLLIKGFNEQQQIINESQEQIDALLEIIDYLQEQMNNFEERIKQLESFHE